MLACTVPVVVVKSAVLNPQLCATGEYKCLGVVLRVQISSVKPHSLHKQFPSWCSISRRTEAELYIRLS